MATLLGYGADGICPYVAYEALFKMNAEGHVRARAQVGCLGGMVCLRRRARHYVF